MSITAGDQLQSSTRGDGRERILDEARTRFLSNGYAETSMQEIADAVGMTKPALYYHFKDKQDLLLAVMEREMTVALTVFQENLTADKSLEGQRLSTVNVIDSAAGQTAMVFALAGAATSAPGHYGVDGGEVVLPPGLAQPGG